MKKILLFCLVLWFYCLGDPITKQIERKRVTTHEEMVEKIGKMRQEYYQFYHDLPKKFGENLPESRKSLRRIG